jgi:hypothetical protein
MTGCNQLRNELKADGASGARNKNSHGVILIFVATERQVVGANVKSSVECGGGGKLCGAELGSGRGRWSLDGSMTSAGPNKKGALSARLKCFSGNDRFSES